MGQHRDLRLRVAAALGALIIVGGLLVPAATVADQSSSKGNASNKAPSNQKPTFPNEDDDGGTSGVQVNPTAGGTRTVSVQVSSDDGNGNADVNSCDFTVYEPDNSTVHISKFSASKQSGSGKTATYAGSFDMEYWHAAGTYHVKAACEDRTGTNDTAWNTFDYTELSSSSMNVTTASFDDGDGDGSLDPDDITHDTPVNVTVENTGNVQIDISFNGTDAGNGEGDYFNVSDFHMDTDQDGNFSTNEWKLKYAMQTDTTFDLAPSSDGTASTKFVLFAVHVPNVPPADYTGQFTMEAVKG